MSRARHRASWGFWLRILFFVAGFLLAGGTAAVAFYVINVVGSGTPGVSQAAQLAAPTAPRSAVSPTTR